MPGLVPPGGQRRAGLLLQPAELLGLLLSADTGRAQDRGLQAAGCSSRDRGRQLRTLNLHIPRSSLPVILRARRTL